MIEKIQNVQLLAITPDAQRVCTYAARQCYSDKDMQEIMQSTTEQDVMRLMEHCVKSRHLAVLEHASATFAVSGCSRSFMAQMTRHRHLSYSVQSQHYIRHDQGGFVVPDSVRNVKGAYVKYIKSLAVAHRVYKDLVAAGIPKEDARQVLPNGIEARMVISGNLRAWYEFLERRLCRRNTEEIKRFSERVLEILTAACPEIFRHCGPPCKRGFCHEQVPCYTEKQIAGGQ